LVVPLVTTFQDTPHPHALKVVLDTPLKPGPFPRSYFTSSAVGSDALAAKLFSLQGVTNLLIHEQWVTVSKSPDAQWTTLKPAIKAIFAEAV
jgi:hypothetical protein